MKKSRIKGQFVTVEVLRSFLWLRLVVFNHEHHSDNGKYDTRDTAWVAKWNVFAIQLEGEQVKGGEGE